MRVDLYRLVSDRIEVGLGAGWRRAHKHDNAPTENDVLVAQHDAIMEALADYIVFSDDDAAA